MMTLSLSIAAIQRLVYALSALRSHYHRNNGPGVPLLTADHRAALAPLVRAAIAEAALAAGGRVAGEDDGIVNVEVEADQRTAATLLTAFQQGCALKTLQLANAGYDTVAAADYGNEAAAAMESLKAVLAGIAAPGKIVPRWY